MPRAWLRQYNASPGGAVNPVGFYGMDLQSPMLGRQYDAVIHIDRTNFVQPLPADRP